MVTITTSKSWLLPEAMLKVSDISFINSNIFYNKLKLNKVSGSFQFLSDKSNVSRIGTFDPLRTKYVNGIGFNHSFEIIKFNSDFEKRNLRFL